eukprot:5691083-Amphidinium_carterae.2
MKVYAPGLLMYSPGNIYEVSRLDADLLKDLEKGFDLAGSIVRLRVRDLPDISEQQYFDLVWLQGTLLGPSENGEADEALWCETLSEIQKGWASGPFESIQDLCAQVGCEVAIGVVSTVRLWVVSEKVERTLLQQWCLNPILCARRLDQEGPSTGKEERYGRQSTGQHDTSVAGFLRSSHFVVGGLSDRY